jgi:hypothetical protein
MTRAGCVLLLAALAGAGCKQRKIDVVTVDKDLTGDYGRHALRAAVERFRATPRDANAYRALALEVARLRPSFNQDVADEAERNLVFLALGPMEAQLDRPLDEQLRALALTVWPTALHVEPKQGEDPQQYLQRACNESLAAECKYVVPEYWPLMLSQEVWRRFKNRARDAFGDCRPCKQEPSYAALLESYDRHDSELTKRANASEDRASRNAWPEAGPNAQDWTGNPLLDLGADPIELSGEPVEGDWRKRLRSLRAQAPVLGVHLKPRTEVRVLRDILQAAAKAGYTELALQARRRDYPYHLAEYRLTTKGPARPVDVRDIDTIQSLVRTLDQEADRSGAKAHRLSAR